MFFVFFFNDTATTEIYTLSLHDALPICFAVVSAGVLHTCGVTAGGASYCWGFNRNGQLGNAVPGQEACAGTALRSEEHTSELQSRLHLVCRLLLEKKTTIHFPMIIIHVL